MDYTIQRIDTDQFLKWKKHRASWVNNFEECSKMTKESVKKYLYTSFLNDDNYQCYPHHDLSDVQMDSKKYRRLKCIENKQEKNKVT